MSAKRAKRGRRLEDALLTAQLDVARMQGSVRELEVELARERLARVAAQMGLVNYMTEHGLGHRIGYDPRQDAAVLQEVAEGKIPPLDTLPLRPYRAVG